MKNMKRILAGALAGMVLSFGIVCSSAASEISSPSRGFVITCSSTYYLGEGVRYAVEIKSEENKAKDPEFPYDGNKSASYLYCSPGSEAYKLLNQGEYDKNGDGWIKIIHEWTGDSRNNTGKIKEISDIAEEYVPGKPSYSKEETFLMFKVDSDTKEEYYAKGDRFASKEAAIEWACNMARFFESEEKISQGLGGK